MAWLPTDKRHYIFLILLLSADVTFILLHLGHVHSGGAIAPSELFSLEMDRGYAEVFQYVKMFWITGMLTALLVKTRSAVYGPWALLFAYLLLDDALMIHELLGERIARSFNYATPMGREDLGELTVSAAAFTVFFILMGVAYLIGRGSAKTISKQLFILLFIIALTGVVFDMLHNAISFYPETLLVVAEDGGEMVAVSLTCWYVFVTLQTLTTPNGPSQLAGAATPAPPGSNACRGGAGD
jgi:hypothetical protein